MIQNKKRISVVIPFFNSEKTLHSCLLGLGSQSLKPFEIILVDNGSIDQSADVAKVFIENYPDLSRYVLETKKGPASARNCGANISQGDIITFIDSDCVPDKNWLRNLVMGFQDPKIGAVAGKIESFSAKTLYDKFHSMFTLKSSNKSKIFSEFLLVKGAFPTANLAVRSDVFKIIGGFDENLPIYSEDYDLCARIYQKGYFIEYLPKVKVYHQHRNTLKETWRQSFGFGTGHSNLLKKHFKRLVIIDLPRFQYITKWLPLRLWFDAAGADKKIFLIITLSILWLPALILIPLFLIYLFFYMNNHLIMNGLTAGFFEKWQLVFLLIVKSTALTAGRLKGAVLSRVMCL